MGTKKIDRLAAHELVLFIGAWLCLFPQSQAQVVERNTQQISEDGFEAGLRTAVSHSDNIGLNVEGSERAGWLLEVSPFLRLKSTRQRSHYQLDYRLRTFKRWPESDLDQTLTHELDGSLNTALVGDSVWLAATASVANLTLSPLNASLIDPSAQPGNTIRNSNLSIGPYVRGSIGLRSDYVAGFNIEYDDISPGQASTYESRLAGLVRNQPTVGSFGWRAIGQSAKRTFVDNDSDIDSTQLDTQVTYRPSRALQLGAGLEYSRISVLEDESGVNDGFSPSVSALWSPTRRTSFDIRASKPFYGSNVRASLTYQLARIGLGMEYHRAISTNSGPLFNTDATPGATATSPIENPSQVTDNAGSAFADVGRLGPRSVLSGAIFRRTQLAVVVNYARRRNLFEIRAAREKSDPLLTTAALPTIPDALESFVSNDLTVSYRRTINHTTGLTAFISRSDVESLSTDSDSLRTTAGMELNRRFGRKAQAGFGLRLTRQRAQGNADNFRERTVYFYYDVQL